MKKIKIVMCILFAFLSIPISSVAENTVCLAIGEWPPYFSNKMKQYGLLAEVIHEAFSLEGIQITYQFYPWKRALEYVKIGECNGSPGWTKTPEREILYYYSVPIFESKGVFFHLKSYPFTWKTVEDLKGIPMGGTIGFDYGEMIQNAEKSGQISIDRISSDKQNFKKLLAGRISIFPELIEVGLEELRNDFTPEEIKLVTFHPKPYRSSSYYLLMSRQNKHNETILAAFNRGIEQLKANGRFNEIMFNTPSGTKKTNN